MVSNISINPTCICFYNLHEEMPLLSEHTNIFFYLIISYFCLIEYAPYMLANMVIPPDRLSKMNPTFEGWKAVLEMTDCHQFSSFFSLSF